MAITVTDAAGTSGSVTVDSSGDVVEAIRAWYPEPSTEVLDSLTALQDALNRREYTGGWEQALGITIEHTS